jgi:GNAT superfamily N-acetyltransferase
MPVRVLRATLLSMYTIRNASSRDIDAVVDLQARSLRETLGLPAIHTHEEDLDFYTNTVFVKCIVLVAEAEASVVGFIAYRKDWIDHLRVDSRHHRVGIGKALLDRAKQAYPYLQLWCFQHIPARGFYRSQGFAEVEYTAGNNEEKLPDVRMEWRR